MTVAFAYFTRQSRPRCTPFTTIPHTPGASLNSPPAQPAAPAAAGAAARGAKTYPRHARTMIALGQAAGPGRHDPPPARRRADRRARGHRHEDQDPRQGTDRVSHRARIHSDAAAPHRTPRRRPAAGRPGDIRRSASRDRFASGNGTALVRCPAEAGHERATLMTTRAAALLEHPARHLGRVWPDLILRPSL
jgi:hypothetical protein